MTKPIKCLIWNLNDHQLFNKVSSQITNVRDDIIMDRVWNQVSRQVRGRVMNIMQHVWFEFEMKSSRLKR